jgi:hypothetical protein
VVICGDEGNVVLDIHTGVKDCDWDTGADGSIHGCCERTFIGGRDGQRIHLSGDHGIHDLDLASVIGLLVRTVPKDAHARLAGGLVYTGVDGQKEEMRGCFGNNSDKCLRARAAGCQERKAQYFSARGHFRIIQKNRNCEMDRG